MKVFFILLLLTASIFACTKEPIEVPYQEFCWTCVTNYTYTLYFKEYENGPYNDPVIFTSEAVFNVCNMSEDNILLFEETGSDSVWWQSGPYYNIEERVTRCTKQ